jgi:hypothetical protein
MKKIGQLRVFVSGSNSACATELNKDFASGISEEEYYSLINIPYNEFLKLALRDYVWYHIDGGAA